MPPSRVLLHLLSLSASPSFLLVAARESLASLEEEIAKLRLAEAEDAAEAETGGLSGLGNGGLRVKRDRTYGEVKQNVQATLLENGGDTRSTTIEGGDSKGEQALNLNKNISVINAKDPIKPILKKLSDIEIITTGTNENQEPRFMKDLREKNKTILELEEQEAVFRQDVRF